MISSILDTLPLECAKTKDILANHASLYDSDHIGIYHSCLSVGLLLVAGPLQYLHLWAPSETCDDGDGENIACEPQAGKWNIKLSGRLKCVAQEERSPGGECCPASLSESQSEDVNQ
jgi:hypothetical protein